MKRGLDKGLFGFDRRRVVVVTRRGFHWRGGEEGGATTIAGVAVVESVNSGELLSEKHGHWLVNEVDVSKVNVANFVQKVESIIDTRKEEEEGGGKRDGEMPRKKKKKVQE